MLQEGEERGTKKSCTELSETPVSGEMRTIKKTVGGCVLVPVLGFDFFWCGALFEEWECRSEGDSEEEGQG